MKGKTLIRIGAIWLTLLMLSLLVLAVAARSAANMFVGFGIELPFSSGTVAGRLALRLFFVLVYSLLLGWIPFLLIGVLRLVHERAKKPEVGIEIE